MVLEEEKDGHVKKTILKIIIVKSPNFVQLTDSKCSVSPKEKCQKKSTDTS